MLTEFLSSPSLLLNEKGWREKRKKLIWWWLVKILYLFPRIYLNFNYLICILILSREVEFLLWCLQSVGTAWSSNSLNVSMSIQLVTCARLKHHFRFAYLFFILPFPGGYSCRGDEKVWKMDQASRKEICWGFTTIQDVRVFHARGEEGPNGICFHSLFPRSQDPRDEY